MTDSAATEPNTKKRRPPGRPKGSANRRRETAATQPARCARCESTNRGPYTRKTEQAHPGIDAAGREFTHVVRRWCACADCGQFRIELTHENRPAEN